ncbi:phospholipid carrier-dependent glycosyltransferase [Marmoricola endophyticus]|uniref:Polyprenol-phosphate-mannose--protein mannosyltransferase n=1 Tax=Marmoricola endophyticus TaxID=2040280 RepID=A0A917F847_9ACTN|nr:phospholipid carrier-dependent glycosyltransferase [Marmoricola endophyticus]GGF52473.1 phospholipid carrier-dependent glycosyltransferase [Marmoricola endophyticus]
MTQAPLAPARADVPDEGAAPGPFAVSDRVAGWVATFAVGGLALFLRLWHLGRPHAFEFDETYYAKDAWSLLHFGYAQNYVDDANDKILGGQTTGIWKGTPEMVVHPEVGKWLIAAGEHLFGMNPFGWRFASAIVGTLMVVVMVRLARRITGSTLLGVVGGLLMCLDGLQLVLSRLALLDIFQAFFVLCAVACLVADRDWGRARLAELAPDGVRDGFGPVRRMLLRPWRVLAGVWFGLACGTKWSTVFLIAGFGLLVWAWDAGARRRIGVREAWLRSALVDALPAFGWLVLLPVVIYTATWTGWLLHASVYEDALSNTQYGPYWGSYLQQDTHGFLAEAVRSLRSLWHYHHDVYSFHTGPGLAQATHPYQSNPLGWTLLSRPVGVDAQLDIKPGVDGCTAATDSTCLRQVLLLGNPAVWWGGTAALAYAVAGWFGRRDWRYGVVLVGALTAWLPWLRYDDRPIFSYYAIVIEPFLILGLVLVLGRVLGPRGASAVRRRVGALAAGAYVLVVVLLFGWFWPIWTDALITTPDWLDRIWFKRWI